MSIVEENVMVAEYLGLLPMETGAYFLPQFGYMNGNCLWKDSFMPDQLKFHRNWIWLMWAVRKCAEKNNCQLLVDSKENEIDVFKRVVNLVLTLKNHNYDN